MNPMKINAVFRSSVIGTGSPGTGAADLRATSPSLPPDALAIRVHGDLHIIDVVAPELVAVGAGEHDRQHRLAHDARGGAHAGVRARAPRPRGLLRGADGPAPRLGPRQQRLRGHPRAQS